MLVIWNLVYIPPRLDIKSYEIATNNIKSEVYIPPRLDIKKKFCTMSNRVYMVYIPPRLDIKRIKEVLRIAKEKFTFLQG